MFCKKKINQNKMNSIEKIQRNSNDILIIPTEEEDFFRKKFKDTSTNRKCTMCGNLIKDFQSHPALRVIVCSDCFQYYDNTVFLSNKDGTDKNCRWCAKSSAKYCCSSCTVVFCPDCLNRNFSATYVDDYVKNNPEWKCLICNQKQLWALRAQCANAYNETDDELDATKKKPETNATTTPQNTVNEGSEASASSSDFDEIPESLKNKKLPPETMKEARDIFEQSKEKFDRLIDKIKHNCTIFSTVTKNRELKSAEDVLELTKKVSCMCKCIHDAISWIDDCNKNAYREWLNVNICETSSKSPQHNDSINAQHSTKTPDSKLSDHSIDLLNNHPTNTQQNVKTELLNSSFETNIMHSTSTDNDETKKELRQTKTKEILQSLRLKKQPNTESQTSGISENFLNFLDKVKVDLSKNEENQSTSIKNEPKDTNNSLFSSKTIVLDSPEKDKSKSTSKTASFTQNGELQDRILTDFDDTGVNIELKTVQYLCDKTGDIFDGFEISSSGNSTPIIVFNDEHHDSFSDSEDLHNFSNKIMEKLTESNDAKEEIFSYSPDLIKLLNNDFTDETTKLNEDQDEDLEIKNEIEQEKELVFKYLVDSDCSTFSSMSSISSSSSSVSEEKYVIKDEENRGYIQTLDIANELHKLRNNLPKSEIRNETPEEDPKFTQNCEVRLERMNFDEASNLQKIPNTSSGYRILNNSKQSDNSEDSENSDKSKSDDDEDKEINQLLNLKTLEKKKRCKSSSSNSDSNKSMKHRQKKKKFTSKSECDTDSSFSSRDANTSDVSSDDILSDYEPSITSNKKSDDDVNILNDLVSSDSDYSFKEITSNSDSDSDNNSEKNECKKKIGRKDEVPEWKKDVLLTGRLNVSLNSDKTKSNNEINDELLEKEEVKFLEKFDDKNNLTKKSDDDNDDNDKNAIILSDTESSDSDSDNDSDIIFVTNKRKKTDTDESMSHKKGRRNIKKVLDDSELQAETQIADLEEERRKERISMKNRSLDAVLSQSSLSQEDIGLVLDVDEINKTSLVKIPQVLVTPLKPHQVNGIKFMWNVCFESVNQIKQTPGSGCILAHCMGLGKTRQIVVLTYTLLTHKATGLRHALIVCPLSTVFNWRDEYERTLANAPEKISIFDLRSDRLRSFRTRIFEVKKWRQTGGVLIMGYDSFTALVNEEKLDNRLTKNYKNLILEALINPGPDIVVCDEGHILKSCKTHKFKALNRVHTKRRIILTGTPLQNNLMEYWHMVSFVKPHLLGTYKEYSNRFVNPISNGQYEDSSPSDIQLMKKRSHVLHKKLQTTVHRYELSELKQYLPNKHEYVLFIQLSQLQIKLYELYLEKIVGKQRNLFQNFHDLQNIWTHPALLYRRYEKGKTYDEDFDPNLDPDTINSQNSQNSLGDNWYKDLIPSDLTNLNHGSKMVILFSIIRECCALGEKLLVFSSSIPELDLIEEFLVNDAQTWKKNEDYYRMDGSVLPEKRMQYCNSFNNKKNKKARLFLVSHKVGGLGLNLIAANRVVLMDVNWNPAYDTQSVFRVYRFGQEKPCYIYRLVSLGTMEELVYSRAVTKLAISCRVVDEQQIRRHFKEDDQHKLYKLNTDYLHQEPITPNVPTDRLLANLWGLHKPVLYNFKDHQSMLQNLTHEELNEEEMKLAWEEFKKEEETEKARLGQIEQAKELYKQAFAQQQNMYQIIPSTSGFMQQQVTRFKPPNPLPINARPVMTNPRPLLNTPRPLLNTPLPLLNTPRPLLNTPRPLLPTPRSTVTNPRPTITNPRPVGLISNKTIQLNQMKPNPFNPHFKNTTNTEMIIPDIFTTNNIPAHSNSFKTLPSTSSASPVVNIPINVNKKVYGDPKIDKNTQNNNASTSNGTNGSKRMPKLVPVKQNINMEFLAKNGVSISPKPKNRKINMNDDEIINLE